MLKFYVALQVTALTMLAGIEDRVTRHREERGSVTIQEVFWAVGALAIGGIVYAAIKFFVTSESGKIK